MFTIELSKFFRSEISRTFQFFVPRRISHDNSFRFLYHLNLLKFKTFFLLFLRKWDQDSINGFRLLDSEVRISVRHVTTYNYKILTALRT
ncbi:unnamed protein product [Rhizophagus irregularis]|nr:unnamed protein product [Rhizophagus irregularis]